MWFLYLYDMETWPSLAVIINRIREYCRDADIGELAADLVFENVPSTVILCSILSIPSFLRVVAICHALCKKYPTRTFRMIVGGGFIELLKDPTDLIRFLPPVTHVCVGPGENFIIDFMEHECSSGIYRHVGEIKDIALLPEVYRLHPHAPLMTSTGNACEWRKCAFCHHTVQSCRGDSNGRKVNKPDELVSWIEYYYHEFGQTNFYLFDNNLKSGFISYLIRNLAARGVRSLHFDVFGMRVDSDRTDLGNTLRELGHDYKITTRWGVEFYNQEVLDHYSKGISLGDIDDAVSFCEQHGVTQRLYLLHALPGVIDKHRETHYTFLRRFVTYPALPVNIFCFELSEGTGVYHRRDEFRVRPTTPVLLCHLCQRVDHKVFTAQTIFLDFEAYDDDVHDYLSRAKLIERYDRWNHALVAFYQQARSRTSMQHLTHFTHFNMIRTKNAPLPYG